MSEPKKPEPEKYRYIHVKGLEYDKAKISNRTAKIDWMVTLKLEHNGWEEGKKKFKIVDIYLQ